MATSQNGWSAGNRRADRQPRQLLRPGTKVKVAPGVRSGDVAVVLFYAAEQYKLHVEKLHAGWCWGHNYRAIRGATQLSNHASGTAIEKNAPEHPLGKANTYTAAQIKAIKKILDFCEGVVRCGAFYTGRKDDMHFEIIANAAKVKKVADKIRESRKPKPLVVSVPMPAGPARAGSVHQLSGGDHILTVHHRTCRHPR